MIVLNAKQQEVLCPNGEFLDGALARGEITLQQLRQRLLAAGEDFSPGIFLEKCIWREKDRAYSPWIEWPDFPIADALDILSEIGGHIRNTGKSGHFFNQVEWIISHNRSDTVKQSYTAAEKVFASKYWINRTDEMEALMQKYENSVSFCGRPFSMSHNSPEDIFKKLLENAKRQSFPEFEIKPSIHKMDLFLPDAAGHIPLDDFRTWKNLDKIAADLLAKGEILTIADLKRPNDFGRPYLEFGGNTGFLGAIPRITAIDPASPEASAQLKEILSDTSVKESIPLMEAITEKTAEIERLQIQALNAANKGKSTKLAMGAATVGGIVLTGLHHPGLAIDAAQTALAAGGAWRSSTALSKKYGNALSREIKNSTGENTLKALYSEILKKMGTNDVRLAEEKIDDLQNIIKYMESRNACVLAHRDLENAAVDLERLAEDAERIKPPPPELLAQLAQSQKSKSLQHKAEIERIIKLALEEQEQAISKAENVDITPAQQAAAQIDLTEFTDPLPRSLVEIQKSQRELKESGVDIFSPTSEFPSPLELDIAQYDLRHIDPTTLTPYLRDEQNQQRQYFSHTAALTKNADRAQGTSI